MRVAISPFSDRAAAMSTVNSDQKTTAMKYVSLVPNRSRKMPPGICSSA
jgi:hypothetical protein